MIAVWYLILTLGGASGAVTAIPQESREQCLANAEYLQKRLAWGYASCIPGVLK